MICKQCGAEISDNSVFCPVCEAPVKVTADYDYIQAEIGANVNKFMEADSKKKEEDYKLDIIDVNRGREVNIPKKEDTQQTAQFDIHTATITRTMLGDDDSIFLEKAAQKKDEEEQERQRARRARIRAAERARREAEARARRRKALIIIAAAAVVIIAVIVLIVVLTGKGGESQTTTTTEAVTEAQDVISSTLEEGATYNTPLKVDLSSSNGNRLYYTTDGSTPSINSYRYDGVFVIDEAGNYTIRAVSYTNSSMKAAEFTLNIVVKKATLSAPSFNLPSGDYTSEMEITIFGPDGAEIFYTYDGTQPSRSSTQYEGPIKMKRGNNVLSAIAYSSDGTASDVTTAIYNLEIPAVVTYDKAVESLKNMMISNGRMESLECKTSDGGKLQFVNASKYASDDAAYYVIEVLTINAAGDTTATDYYGINDQTAVIVSLVKSIDGYTVVSLD